MTDINRGFADALNFGLFEALTGRRSRRFAAGSEIPGGPLAFASKEPPSPLTSLETITLLAAMGGRTGWHELHPHSTRTDPLLPAYSIRAGGRTFPSGAGWHTTELFFTDDSGTFVFETRDGDFDVDRDPDGAIDLPAWVLAHRSRIRRIAEGRLALPIDRFTPHNRWGAGGPGTTVVIPVTDLAEMFLAAVGLAVARGARIHDDRLGADVVDSTSWADVLTTDEVWPLTVMEQEVLGFAAAEQGITCQNGMLALTAMGLGSWLFNGADHLAVLGASGDPSVPGLGFRYDVDERWPVPNVTGLAGVFEGACPPHVTDMRAAVERIVDLRYRPGGPFATETPGSWIDTKRIRSAGQRPTPRQIDCWSTIATAIFERYGKFPAALPSIHVALYLQASHLDLAYYERFHDPGAVLSSHRAHHRRWHQTV